MSIEFLNNIHRIIFLVTFILLGIYIILCLGKEILCILKYSTIELETKKEVKKNEKSKNLSLNKNKTKSKKHKKTRRRRTEDDD